MIIDAHNHLFDRTEKNYADKLYEAGKKAKFDKICLMAIPDFYNISSNKETLAAMKKYPPRATEPSPRAWSGNCAPRWD